MHRLKLCQFFCRPTESVNPWGWHGSALYAALWLQGNAEHSKQNLISKYFLKICTRMLPVRGFDIDCPSVCACNSLNGNAYVP